MRRAASRLTFRHPRPRTFSTWSIISSAAMVRATTNSSRPSAATPTTLSSPPQCGRLRPVGVAPGDLDGGAGVAAQRRQRDVVVVLQRLVEVVPAALAPGAAPRGEG